MRKTFTFLLFFVFLMSFAQIDVKDFYCAENDMSAQDARVDDDNGGICALIKIETTQKGFTFDNGSLGIKATEQKVGEIWVFVPGGTRRLTIHHADLGILRDYGFPEVIKAGRTYIMQLITGTVEHVVHNTVTQQYVVFNVAPNEATIELNGEMLPVRDGTASKRLPFGTYDYRVQAHLYHPEVGTVTVNDPQNKHKLSVSLLPAFGYISVGDAGALAGAQVYVDDQSMGTAPCKSGRLASGRHQVRIMKNLYSSVSQSVTVEDGKTTEFSPTLSANYAEMTFEVNNEAEIWINGDKKGVGRWTGKLASGGYEIECRKENHRSTRREIEVSSDMMGQTVTLEAPRAIVGSVDVNSSPTDADVYIDGSKVGTSPVFLPEYIIGRHDIKLSKSGYGDYTSSFTLTEGQTHTVDATLSSGREVTVMSDIDGAWIVIDDVERGQGRFTGSLSYGEHMAYAKSLGKTSNVTRFTVTQGSGSMGTVMVKFAAESKTFTVKNVTFEMIPVEAGTFQMGSSTGGSDEKPVHSVTITRDYYMGETEVTQALWEAVMGTNPSYYKGNNRPVEQVSWYDCQDFLKKLNRLTGQNFRLPTEAEWEYAARGGKKSKGYTYSGSNDIDEVAVYNKNGGHYAVKSKKPNELGLYDMSGNVWEWCQDWYYGGYYSKSPSSDPTGANSGSSRVLRGGSWDLNAERCRVAYRSYGLPEYRYDFRGLRLCLPSLD